MIFETLNKRMYMKKRKKSEKMKKKEKKKRKQYNFMIYSNDYLF